MKEGVCPEAVVLLNTQFWTWQSEIEDFLGGRVEVVDGRDELLRDVCKSLGLMGVDGRRPKNNR